MGRYLRFSPTEANFEGEFLFYGSKKFVFLMKDELFALLLFFNYI